MKATFAWFLTYAFVIFNAAAARVQIDDTSAASHRALTVNQLVAVNLNAVAGGIAASASTTTSDKAQDGAMF